MSNPSLTLSDSGALTLSGPLTFGTVTQLFEAGLPSGAPSTGDVVYDLAQVTDVDSAGLALLVDWVSDARAASRGVRFENVPAGLNRLAQIASIPHLFA